MRASRAQAIASALLGSVLLAGSLGACSGEPAVPPAGATPAASAATARPAKPSHTKTTPAKPSPTAPAPVTAAHPLTAARLDTVVATALGSRKATSTVCLVDLRTGATYVYHGALRIHTASIVKVLVLVSVLRYQADRGKGLTSGQKALAARMIGQSDNNATSALVSQIGNGSVTKVIKALGMSSTTFGGSYWGHTLTSARDQATLVKALVTGTPILTAAQRSYVLDLMEDVTPSQHWGVGTEPKGATAQVKNGWYPEAGGWRINSIGHVTGPGGRNYVLTVLTRGNSSMAAGVDRVSDLARAVYAAMALPLAT